MKAFLLAAGRGTRISRFVDDVPKCTLPVAGVPLIRKTAEILLNTGFEVVVCVGYKSSSVYDALESLPVTYYVNPFYEVTNSIASLWFARDEIKSDILILNADVYFTKRILDSLMLDNRDAVMVIDHTRTENGDYYFSTTADGTIKKYGKTLPLKVRTCEYVGIAKISHNIIMTFKERLNALVMNAQYNLWWENVLYSFTDDRSFDIHTMDVNGDFWAEIDYFDDYQRILKHVEKMDELNG